MSEHKSLQLGFTLLEVLIAMSILAVTMIALIQTVSLAAGSETHLQDKVLAQWVALNQISRMQLAGEPHSPGIQTDNADMAGRSWRWQSSISRTANARLLKVVVDVGRADQQDFLHSVTAYLRETP